MILVANNRQSPQMPVPPIEKKNISPNASVGNNQKVSANTLLQSPIRESRIK